MLFAVFAVVLLFGNSHLLDLKNGDEKQNIVESKRDVSSIFTLTQATLLSQFGNDTNAAVELSLVNKGIEAIEQTAFNGFRELILLNLRGNQIESLADFVFNDLVNLEELNLMQNKLTALSRQNLLGLASLKRLVLESNRLVRIDSFTFVGLTKLEGVYLFSNPIVALFPENLTPLCKSNSKCSLTTDRPYGKRQV